MRRSGRVEAGEQARSEEAEGYAASLLRGMLRNIALLREHCKAEALFRSCTNIAPVYGRGVPLSPAEFSQDSVHSAARSESLDYARQLAVLNATSQAKALGRRTSGFT